MHRWNFFLIVYLKKIFFLFLISNRVIQLFGKLFTLLSPQCCSTSFLFEISSFTIIVHNMFSPKRFVCFLLQKQFFICMLLAVRRTIDTAYTRFFLRYKLRAALLRSMVSIFYFPFRPVRFTATVSRMETCALIFLWQ